METDKGNLSLEQIEAALRAGIISDYQARSLRSAHMHDDEAGHDEAPIFGDENNLRFIRGFSDIFIGTGLILLVLGISAIFALLGGGGLYLGAAALMWAGSEYFGRKKRAHFPTLILALSFLLFVLFGASAILPSQIGKISLSGALIALIAMLAYYIRFRLPFCIALITLSSLMLIWQLCLTLLPIITKSHFGSFMLIGGIITFLIAMTYDIRDIDRRTRFADNAFWLHLMAAPLIVHGLAVMTIRRKSELAYGLFPSTELGSPDAILTLIGVFILVLIGLAINRRALIASSLIYAIIALIYLLAKSGLGVSGTITGVLLITGIAIVLLGIGWSRARIILLNILPKNGIWGKIFPPENPASP